MYQILKPGGWMRACERLNSFSKIYPESKAIEQTWASIYHYFEREFSKSPSITNNLPFLLGQAGFVEIETQGFSTILSKNQLGKTFEWYIGVAHDMFEKLSKDLLEKKLTDENIMKTALADYQNILSSHHSFILETAIAVAGIKP